MRANKTTKVFISAERPEVTKAGNERATSELACDLAGEGYDFREVLGCMDGIDETAFCVFVDDPDDTLETLRDIGRTYAQDTVLVVHGDDAAEYLDCHDPARDVIMGCLVPVERPHGFEDWHYVDGCYWVVRRTRHAAAGV